ncbi:glycosyltransferase family 2 protein [Undibacterium sp. Jales W-56]|uniref:glycosyltransferase family 2 protein n=1 Tax=Undibacterium sp. Jales W-56 TaxID=2897325 RepID=UPI0021D3671B|nr:glycosyltransferase family 2 protein [Undibacterium sp. Jales W-56]MCU6434127.1 glycosyltransferase family 2 protein [Undibacterium sp. Jales W-56]
MSMQNKKINKYIAIFAHNESQNIMACLHSVKRAISEGDQCIVLNNGSTDNTDDLVARFASENSFCTLKNIQLGDKANAWNAFIHDFDVEAGHYYFLDGDCALLPDSLTALEDALNQHPEAHVAAALPADGVGDKDKEMLLREGGLCGNLYALSGQFVAQLRSSKVRLPVGLIGDDSLIGALAYWDLKPQQNWDMRRIFICERARFTYDPLSVLSLHDLRLYYRRKIRYSLRYFQNKMLKAPLKAKGLDGIPSHVNQLYHEHMGPLALTWRGLNTWFDWLALKRIRQVSSHSGKS